ncbi:MAG: hypothetical protein IKT27_01900 [Clostridia bacterium]|nr:hypothetical protein [Clostridia bacterium]
MNTITLSEIREDLRDIRYYYSRKELFRKASSNVGINYVEEKLSKYNNAICLAPPRLYDLYVSLYLENNTQESLSEKLCYSPEYISKLNKQLVNFFLKNFNETKEETNNE